VTPLINLWRSALRGIVRFYYRAALEQINPLHPDVPYIVHRLSELRELQS
jgi:hypothetical protein